MGNVVDARTGTPGRVSGTPRSGSRSGKTIPSPAARRTEEFNVGGRRVGSAFLGEADSYLRASEDFRKRFHENREHLGFEASDLGSEIGVIHEVTDDENIIAHTPPFDSLPMFADETKHRLTFGHVSEYGSGVVVSTLIYTGTGTGDGTGVGNLRASASVRGVSGVCGSDVPAVPPKAMVEAVFRDAVEANLRRAEGASGNPVGYVPRQIFPADEKRTKNDSRGAS